MEFKDVLTMYFERGLALQTFWNFYITVAVGILAFIGVIPSSRSDKLVASILTLGFALFAVVNLSGMIGVSNQRMELQSLLMEDGALKQESYPRPTHLSRVRATLNAPSLGSLVSFHLLVDVLMVSSIWIIPTLRRSV
jgi:hypothetical protein